MCKPKCFIMTKLFLLTLLLPLTLFSSSINLEWLQEQPKSFARDFYILQFLKQDITPDDANQALELIHNMNMTLFYAYAKKLQHDETYAVVQCLEAKNSDLLQNSVDCLSLGLSIYDATLLSYEEKNIAYEKLKKKYPQKAEVISILNAPLPFTKLIAASNETFFDVFNQCGSAYRQRYFNYKLPLKKLQKLQQEKEFYKTIKLIITDPQLENLQRSLLQEFSDASLNASALFFLGINALMHEKDALAQTFFEQAIAKSYLRFDKDKINFWLYQTTQDNSYLEKLSKSLDINIYTLYAKEKLKQSFDNIIYQVETKKNKQKSFDVTNPFEWFAVRQKLQADEKIDIEYYENLFNTASTQAHLAFIYEKAFQYQKHYFISPFDVYLKDVSNKRKSLIYALAKQESHFIPSSISPVYAMGAMQIMPFLAQHIAQKLEEPFNIYAQLNPKTNLKYANYQLNYLEKHLHNPLFVAYAYNGGIGFTLRMLKTERFEKKNRHEPFLSMELVPVEESREYGKKVLANYYIYHNHLNPKNSISFTALIQTIQKSDRK